VEFCFFGGGKLFIQQLADFMVPTGMMIL
jgi:hypothetical protein